MPINQSLMDSLQKQYGKKKGRDIYWRMFALGKVPGENRKKSVHVKSYYRKRHGRATFGGQVSAHNKKSGRMEMYEYESGKPPRLVVTPTDKKFDKEIKALEKQLIEASKQVKWCECGDESGDWIFKDDNAAPHMAGFKVCNIKKHHYHCKRCGGVTQIG